MTPIKRYFKLLRLDRKDISQIVFYAVFSGFISLSLPLGIQAIINFIQAGRVSVSWIVLVVLVVIGVTFVGILSLMQLRITENLQQKIFIRSSFEFAYRLPKIKVDEIYDFYPPELANRFFDTLSIQKGTSKLLIDFSAALLQIAFGLILLSLYHPFFILFGILLGVLLYLIFRFSYTKGLATSLKESKFKYRVAGWLQEIARNNFSFRKENAFNFALSKNDLLVSDYLGYREKHFVVIKNQFIQLITFKVIITASLLLIGGFLVINQQMNIGQFVAAEIIILLVINSVEKIILGLETFYDVLTSVEKIGQVTDLTLEPQNTSESKSCFKEISLQTEKVSFSFPNSNIDTLQNISLAINQGEKIVLSGENGSGKSTLIRVLAGLLQPTSGYVYSNDDTFQKIDLKQFRSQTGTIIQNESPFEGTILENLTYGQEVSAEKLKWAIEAVRLGDLIKSLPNGLHTTIFPEGKQLSSSDAQKILLARSIIGNPRVLFYEDPTNKMDDNVAKEIIDFIFSSQNDWTVIVISKNNYWKTKCTREIVLQNGKIIQDLKK